MLRGVRDSKAFKEPSVLRVLKAYRELRDSKVFRELKDSKVFKEH